MEICTKKCWTPVACPVHAEPMQPFGRSGADYPCCDSYTKSALNPRHLWNIHDSTRWYTDPDGWAAHEYICEECNPKEETP